MAREAGSRRGQHGSSASGRSSRRRRHHQAEARSATTSSSSSRSSNRGSSRQASHSLAVPVPVSPHSRQRTLSSASSTDGAPLNPPTPGHLDISLHSLRNSNGNVGSSRSSNSDVQEGGVGNDRRSSNEGDTNVNRSSSGSYFPQTSAGPAPSSAQRFSSRTSSTSASGMQSPSPSYRREAGTSRGSERQGTLSPARIPSPSPPPYSASLSPGGSGSDHATDDASSSGTLNQARRSSGRTHRLANSALGAGSSSHAPATSSNDETSSIGVEGETSTERSSNTWGETISGWWGSRS